MTIKSKLVRGFMAGVVGSVVLAGCGFDPYSLPLPGGADLGDDPYTVKVHFRDVLDLVPQSSVRVDDIAVGKVREIKLDGWNALVTLEVNKKAKLPDNAFASIRQTSLLGEKFVSLEAPSEGATGKLGSGDVIPLTRSGRNPEVEEVLGATSLLFNGGGIEKTKTIVEELGTALDGREPEIKELLNQTNDFVGQLDENKEAILTSLEQVNRLAVETNKQKSAITGALDEFPEALRVLDEQRGDLVTLLEALDRLGDVGTRVIEESKDDTIKDLKLLTPILRELTASGDNLPETLATLLTFPFPDGVVGETPQEAKNFVMGEYGNLSVRLPLTKDRLLQFLGLSDLVPGGPEVPDLGDAAGDVTDPTALLKLVGGLVPKTSTPKLDDLEAPSAPAKPGAKSPTQPTPKAPANSGAPEICTLLGSCRAAVKSVEDANATDVGNMLMTAAVAR